MATLVGTPASGYEAGATDANITLASGITVEVNDVVVVAFGGFHATATVSSITSALVTTFTQAGTLLRGGAQSPPPFLAVYYGVVTSAGTLSVTGTMSANFSDKRLSCIVWRGVDTSTPLNQTNGGTGSDASAETGDITTTQPGPMMGFVQEWGWPAAHNQNVGTPNTGWTEWGDTATGADNKYQNFTDTGTRNGNFTWTDPGDDDWVARVVALSDAAAGGEAAISIVPLIQNYRNMGLMQ